MTTPDPSPLAVGDALPAWTVPITTTFVVSTAIATRDYQDVHHDRDLAQAAGSQDIFLNILTSNGLVERYVIESLGAGHDLRGIAIRLGAPAHPGDTLTFGGAVEAVEGRDLTLAVHGLVSSPGRYDGQAHVTGTVRVRRTGGAA